MQEKEVITLESLDNPGSLAINGMDPVDLYTMLGPLVAIPMVTSMAGVPPLLGVAGGIIGFVIGVFVVYATPSYLNVIQTVRTWRYYLEQPKEVRQFETAATEANDSVLKSIEADATTEDFVGLKTYYPEQDIIERSDGTYAGLLELHPPNLDFTQGEMTKIAGQIGDYYNEQVDFKTRIVVTSEPFKINDYIDNLKARRSSSDVHEKPIMQALLDEQIQKRPKQLEKTGTQQTKYYLLIETQQRSVHTSAVQDKTPVERLAEIPLLGIIAEIFINVSDDSTELEQHGETIQTLKKRMQRTQKGISSGIEGWDVSVVSLAEWMLFLQRFNKGREVKGSAPIRQQSVQTTTEPTDSEDGSEPDEEEESTEGEVDGDESDDEGEDEAEDAVEDEGDEVEPAQEGEEGEEEASPEVEEEPDSDSGEGSEKESSEEDTSPFEALDDGSETIEVENSVDEIVESPSTVSDDGEEGNADSSEGDRSDDGGGDK